eukprot:COSAG06_NODE_7651_length_2428_cov_2.026621_1_plen_228_part_10
MGDQVDAAIDDSLNCPKGHALRGHNGMHHSCNACHKNSRHLREAGMRGTAWRCSKCDYNVCQKCYEKMIGTNLQWYRGVVVRCSGEGVTVHYELLSNDKNAETSWTSNKLSQRGKGSGGDYHYRKLRPNPEDEEDETALALRGFKMSGLTEEQLQAKQAKWRYREADEGGDSGTDSLTIDVDLTERLERGYQRSMRLGMNEFSYTIDGTEYQLDLLTMRETNLETRST